MTYEKRTNKTKNDNYVLKNSCIKRVGREIDLVSLNPDRMIMTNCNTYMYHAEF